LTYRGAGAGISIIGILGDLEIHLFFSVFQHFFKKPKKLEEHYSLW
jgi:hypothetical protein